MHTIVMKTLENPPDPVPVIAFSCQDPRWERFIDEWEESVKSVVERVLTHCVPWLKGAEVSLVFVSDAEMRVLNKNYRGYDKPTNVLSFSLIETGKPLNPSDILGFEGGAVLLGDLVFAYETLLKEADAQKKTWKNHFFHLLIHGLLHLLGYDHEKDNEANIMESLEIRLLEYFLIPNPYEADQ